MRNSQLWDKDNNIQILTLYDHIAAEYISRVCIHYNISVARLLVPRVSPRH